MSFSFTDIPRFVDAENYQQAINRMLDRLKGINGLLSVYQVGGVSTPGISDIDLFVVFDDDVKVEINPVENLSVTDRYLFTHNLFGTSQKFVNDVEQFTCFGKYQLIFGKEQNLFQSHIDLYEEKIIKKQIALEYLVKAFITSTIEHSFHTIKLRNLFLHSKALLIDLSFLGIESGRLLDAVNEIMHARNNWFEHHMSMEKLNDMVHHYHASLHEFLLKFLVKENFYLPHDSNLQISRNIFLKPGNDFFVSQKGVMLPKTIAKLHTKIPKILNRMNSFTFDVPAHQHALPEVVVRRQQFISDMVKYQKKYLPHFIPTAYGLNIFGN